MAVILALEIKKRQRCILMHKESLGTQFCWEDIGPLGLRTDLEASVSLANLD